LHLQHAQHRLGWHTFGCGVPLTHMMVCSPVTCCPPEAPLGTRGTTTVVSWYGSRSWGARTWSGYMYQPLSFMFCHRSTQLTTNKWDSKRNTRSLKLCSSKLCTPSNLRLEPLLTPGFLACNQACEWTVSMYRCREFGEQVVGVLSDGDGQIVGRNFRPQSSANLS